MVQLEVGKWYYDPQKGRLVKLKYFGEKLSLYGEEKELLYKGEVLGQDGHIQEYGLILELEESLIPVQNEERLKMVLDGIGRYQKAFRKLKAELKRQTQGIPCRKYRKLEAGKLYVDEDVNIAFIPRFKKYNSYLRKVIWLGDVLLFGSLFYIEGTRGFTETAAAYALDPEPFYKARAVYQMALAPLKAFLASLQEECKTVTE